MLRTEHPHPLPTSVQGPHASDLRPRNRYLIALGSNMGERQANLKKAMELINLELGPILAQSPIWETTPVGPADHLFLNAAVICESSQSAESAMTTLLGIEARMGRQRREKWGNRNIDLDMLLGLDHAGDSIISMSPLLRLPHPLMLARDFVLLPAATIAGEWIHPETGTSLMQALEKLQRGK